MIDRDIVEAARFCVLQHGDRATAHARWRAEVARQKGDTVGADTWLRIIVAIGELGAPPTDARH